MKNSKSDNSKKVLQSEQVKDQSIEKLDMTNSKKTMQKVKGTISCKTPLQKLLRCIVRPSVRNNPESYKNVSNITYPWCNACGMQFLSRTPRYVCIECFDMSTCIDCFKLCHDYHKLSLFGAPLQETHQQWIPAKFTCQ